MAQTMSDTTSSQHIEPESLDALQAIAAGVFARHGVDFATVRRGGGWTNAVWLADGLVLRLCTVEGRDNLLRETRLAALFPPGVGYPALVEAGTTDRHAWTLARRLPGVCLGEAWDGLTWDERTSALRGLWDRAQAVHAVPVAEAAAIAPTRAWFNSNDAAEAEAGLAQLTAQGILTPQQAGVLRETLARFWEAEAGAPRVLCHGDLTLDNAMAHAGQVIGLLDFEYALMAPVQLDLNHLVKAAYGPADATQAPSPADRRGAERLQQAVAELARPLLALPGEKALLMGYAILLELWLLELWLAHPEGEGPLEQWEPLQRLRSLADGAGGFLASLLGC